jgi:hypothetical protein
MGILSTNCQGLGNRPTVRSLLHVQNLSNPDVMFLLETHLDSCPEECFRKRLKMDFKIVNPTTSRSGGDEGLTRKCPRLRTSDQRKRALDELEDRDSDKQGEYRCILRVNLESILAKFRCVPSRPLLAPIYRWPGLKDPVGFDTN